MSLHVLRHCEERFRLERKRVQLTFRLKKTSNEAIPLCELNEKRFYGYCKTFVCLLRAGRLLRGCSNDELNKCLLNPRVSLAMTKNNEATSVVRMML